jgi:hypothetical protein
LSVIVNVPDKSSSDFDVWIATTERRLTFPTGLRGSPLCQNLQVVVG